MAQTFQRRSSTALSCSSFEGRRGWRIDKAAQAETVDAVVALAKAVKRAVGQPGVVEVLGFL